MAETQAAERYLSQLGEVRRPIDGANEIFIYDAWQRNDDETMQRYIAPLKADLTKQLQAGIDKGSIHWELAVYTFMQGATDEALALVKHAFSRGAMRYDVIEWDYEVLGWNELPDFVEVKAEHDAYVRSQRRILLETACGEVGFKSWKPIEVNCQGIDGV